MINKSFQLIRTNPALTTNVKLVVDSKYRLYLETFDTNKQLSDQKYKHHRINSTSLYEREVVRFYDGLANQLAFDVKYDSDNSTVFNTYDKQFDDMYWAGAKYVDDNWYEEDGEYFAPLYIRKGDIPEGFIILRVDEATPYEETDNEFNVTKLTRGNFNTQIVDKWKCVTLFDMRYQSKLGSFLSKNYIENTRFPSRSFELNYKKYDFSKWYGIDYNTGVYVNKSKFLQSILYYEQPHFRLEKEIVDTYKNENLIFPNILNLKFLYNDVPATPNNIRNYSLNRYYGFYADKLEFVTNLTSYLTSEIKPNLTLKNNIFIENGVQMIESPFIEGFDPAKTYWLHINEDFYEVVKVLENSKYVYKIISDIDFSGITLSNFNDRSCIINYSEGYNYRCKTIQNPSGYTNFISGFTSNFKIDPYYKFGVSQVELHQNFTSGSTPTTLLKTGITYTIKSGTIVILDDGSLAAVYGAGDVILFNPVVLPLFEVRYDCVVEYDSPIEHTMYSDLYLIQIDEQYHVLKKRGENYYIQSDYAINSFPGGLEYWKGGKSSKYYVNKPIYKYKEKPIVYPVYRIKFSDVKDFDFDRVNTHFSDFEYEKDVYHVTNEHKLYAVDYNKTTDFQKSFMTHPRAEDGQYQIMNVSSEYIADDELYEISFNNLTSIWRKNQFVVKWGFVGSNSHSDYPYKLNNSLDVGDIYNRTCDIKNSIPTDTAKNLDYFYRIGNLYSAITYQDIFVDSNGIVDVLPENGHYDYDPLYEYWIAVFPDGYVRSEVQRFDPPLPSLTGYIQYPPVYSRTGDVVEEVPLRYFNQSTNIEVDFMEDFSKKFNLDVYLNSDTDYFEYFFKNKEYYTIDDINYIKPTVKYSTFQTADVYSPSTTLFKGININILPVTSLNRDAVSGKILNYITNNKKNFNDYKFSIILNDVYDYYNDQEHIGLSENGLTGNTILDKSVNGIHVFLNDRFKNVLIIINVKIPMQTKFGSFNNVQRFGENYGLYTGRRLDDSTRTLTDPLLSSILKPYDSSLITAANFIDAFDDMNSISEFESGITFYYINPDGIFGSTGPINTYRANSMINIPGWNKLFPPFILTINDPEVLETKKKSYTKEAIKGPTTNIYDKYKSFYDSENKQKLNVVDPLARKMNLNVIEDNLANNLIYRFNGVYEPIFKDIPLFSNIYLYKSLTKNTFDYWASNYKFDTNYTNFGKIEELIFSKVNPVKSPLKLKDTDKDFSIYPMVDEYGYQYLSRFIFNSNWDKDFYIVTNEDTETTMTPVVSVIVPVIIEDVIDTQPPTAPVVYLSALGSSNLGVYWDPAYDANGINYYELFKSEGGDVFQSITILTPADETDGIYHYTDTIAPGITYCYYVVAYDMALNSSTSNIACYTPAVVTVLPPSPAPILSISTTVSSSKTTYISTVMGNTLIHIYMQSDFHVGDILTGNPSIPDGTTIISLGLSTMTMSAPATATLNHYLSTITTQVLTGDAILTWTPSLQGTYPIGGYQLERKIGSGAWYIQTTTTSSVLTVTLNSSNFTPGVLNSFRVCAFDDQMPNYKKLYSDYSNEVYYTRPLSLSAPVLLGDSDSVNNTWLSWTIPTGSYPVVSYEVWRAPFEGEYALQSTLVAPTTDYIDDYYSSNLYIMYFYKVRAKDSMGNYSEFSNVYGPVMVLPFAAVLREVSINTNNIKLNIQIEINTQDGFGSFTFTLQNTSVNSNEVSFTISVNHQKQVYIDTFDMGTTNYIGNAFAVGNDVGMPLRTTDALGNAHPMTLDFHNDVA